MPTDTPNGDGHASNIDRRLDRMSDVITSLTDLMLHNHQQVMEQQRGMLEIIRASVEEVRELIILQREHRMDIMALFEVAKGTERRLDDLEGKSDPGTPK